MAYKIRWSPRAASNFEDICDYIAEDSEYYAALLKGRESFFDYLVSSFPLKF